MIKQLEDFTIALKSLNNTKLKSPTIDNDLLKLQAWIKPKMLDSKALKRLGDLLQRVSSDCILALGMNKDISNKEFSDLMGSLDGVRTAVAKQHKGLKSQGVSYDEITRAFEFLQVAITNGRDYWVRFRNPDQSLDKLMGSAQHVSQLLEMLKTVSRDDPDFEEEIS